MTNNFLDSLRSTVDKEKKSLEQKKNTNIKNRLDNAEKIFSDQDKRISTQNSRESEIIRDAFTIPRCEYDLIKECKAKLLKGEISATKSEVIRAALIALNSCDKEQLINYYNSLKKIKVGRPKLDKGDNSE
jgi:hypothetical protein